jgi:hypothetical protein
MKHRRFEVGDTVIGNKAANERYSITHEGWIGVVTEIINNYDLDTYNDTICVFGDQGHFYVNHRYFDLVETKKHPEPENSKKTVIIENVSLPSCCGECLAFGTTGCIFVNVDTDVTDIWKERASNCPMKPYE